ncbi:hypothetical protein LOY35_07210 [Pseudomonas sp. B21-028]|uniref:hypothetical protein n=1 Tax=Pseudomonas sp. B21-028 TaxID=2895480 RepID=UPI00215E2B26|nr:hypothetical protein [Pseudomonas sp. B21-028]UVL85369.1 hypothetical protein LOY35_07210 [Pseudomonas sp. B21-028]
MKASWLALYIALCCFGFNAYANEASIIIPKYGGQSGASSLSDETKQERSERRHKAREQKAAEHEKKVAYYRSNYDPCVYSDEMRKLSFDAMFDDVDLTDIKCSKEQEDALMEKRIAAEKKRISDEKRKILAEKTKAASEKNKTATVKSKAEPEKQKTQNKQIYSYVRTSKFKSPVGANTQEEALSALNKDIDKAEQDASKPFLNHISGKIINRPAPTCKIGAYQKKWWCESTVTFSGQTYSDPAKEKQASQTTKVQER